MRFDGKWKYLRFSRSSLITTPNDFWSNKGGYLLYLTYVVLELYGWLRKILVEHAPNNFYILIYDYAKYCSYYVLFVKFEDLHD